MSTIVRDVDSWKVRKIIEQAYRDDICLPDFQREFVWNQEQCAKLVESILRQYPIGTLMLLEAQRNESFGKRSFTERSNIPLNSDYYVIDGQQRIMTLLKLLFTPKEFQTSDPIKFNEKTYKFYYKISNSPDFFNKEDVDKPSFIIPVRKEPDEKDYWNKKEFPLEFIFL